MISGTRCEKHKGARERRRTLQRGTARQRGYTTEHDRTRAELLPGAYGQPCPRCGDPMLPGQDLDLGHSVALAVDPSSKADRIEHSSCNRSAGTKSRRRNRGGA